MQHAHSPTAAHEPAGELSARGTHTFLCRGHEPGEDGRKKPIRIANASVDPPNSKRVKPVVSPPEKTGLEKDENLPRRNHGGVATVRLKSQKVGGKFQIARTSGIVHAKKNSKCTDVVQ